MQSLNKNGVSITQTPGQIYYQYDYRHTDGELFSTLAKTLDECRRQRDKWIEKKMQSDNK